MIGHKLDSLAMKDAKSLIHGWIGDIMLKCMRILELDIVSALVECDGLVGIGCSGNDFIRLEKSKRIPNKMAFDRLGKLDTH